MTERTTGPAQSMVVVTSLATYTNQHGDLLVENEETLIYDGGGSPMTGALALERTIELPGHGRVRRRHLGLAPPPLRQRAGWPSVVWTAPVVDGQLFGALLAEMVLDWAGPRRRR